MRITVLYDIVPTGQPISPTEDLPSSNKILVDAGKIVSVEGLLAASDEAIGASFEDSILTPQLITLAVKDAGFVTGKEISLRETPTGQEVVFLRESKKLGLTGKLVRANVRAAVLDMIKTFYNE